MLSRSTHTLQKKVQLNYSTLHMHKLDCINTTAGATTVTASLPAASATQSWFQERLSLGLRPRRTSVQDPWWGWKTGWCWEPLPWSPGTWSGSDQVPSSLSWRTAATCQTQADGRVGISQTAACSSSRHHHQYTHLQHSWGNATVFTFQLMFYSS